MIKNVETRDWVLIVALIVLTFMLLGLQSCSTLQELTRPVGAGPMDKCLAKVPERGYPKAAVVEEIVAWVAVAPDHLVAENTSAMDIYSTVRAELGPYTSLVHRRAVLAESLIILAARESSWNWKAGRDRSASNTSAETMEAGIFQTSCNARNLSPIGAELKAVMATHGVTTCQQFITDTKTNHKLALDFTALLLRYRTDHHGPVKRREINKYLRRGCVEQIEDRL